MYFLHGGCTGAVAKHIRDSHLQWSALGASRLVLALLPCPFMENPVEPNQEFKLIVAGSRGFDDFDLMSRVLIAMADNEFAGRDVSIVSGMAKGADALAVRFANAHKIALYKFPANWNGLGKKAGFIRNTQMGNFADGLLAFWDGESNGTRHMIEYMQRLNKPVHIINYKLNS